MNITLAIGSIARGKSTLLSSPALSTIAPVDMISEPTKKFHARMPMSSRNTKPSVWTRMITVKASV